MTTLLELGAGSARGSTQTLLNRPALRRRVAAESAGLAQERGIEITAGVLRGWMAREDVQEQLTLATDAAVGTAVAGLARLLDGADDVRQEQAVDVLAIVLDSYLRAQSLSDAVTPSDSFHEDLLKFHPWRAAEAEELASRWPPIEEMVLTIT